MNKEYDIDFSGHIVSINDYTKQQIELLMKHIFYMTDITGSVPTYDISLKKIPYKYIDPMKYINNNEIYNLVDLAKDVNSKLISIENAISKINGESYSNAKIIVHEPANLIELNRTADNINIIKTELIGKYMDISKDKLIKYYLLKHNDTHISLWSHIKLEQETIDAIDNIEKYIKCINESPISTDKPDSIDQRKTRAEMIADYIKSIDDKSIDDKSVDDKSIDDKSIDDKSIDDKSIDDKSIDDKSIDDKSKYDDMDLEYLEEDYLSEIQDTFNEIIKHVRKYLGNNSLQIENNTITIPNGNIYSALRYTIDMLLNIPFTTDNKFHKDYTYYIK
uniref:Uncharacterized protein n=1 Tax=viral metagenome TaxID=1070528 RepID=A0A6C0J582_9ZZZZ